MKKLFLAIIVLTGLGVQSASALSLAPNGLQTNLKVMRINHEKLKSVDSGHLDINFVSNTVELTLFRQNNCPINAACILSMPAPIFLKLPLAYNSTDNCGSVYYHAVVDKTPVDGIRETIEVVDNTGNICPHFVALEPTVVDYTTYNPWTNTEVMSRFIGEKLVNYGYYK